jgi:hypothetical protein
MLLSIDPVAPLLGNETRFPAMMKACNILCVNHTVPLKDFYHETMTLINK